MNRTRNKKRPIIAKELDVTGVVVLSCLLMLIYAAAYCQARVHGLLIRYETQPSWGMSGNAIPARHAIIPAHSLEYQDGLVERAAHLFFRPAIAIEEHIRNHHE
jgi:hypothetical protein